MTYDQDFGSQNEKIRVQMLFYWVLHVCLRVCLTLEVFHGNYLFQVGKCSEHQHWHNHRQCNSLREWASKSITAYGMNSRSSQKKIPVTSHTATAVKPYTTYVYFVTVLCAVKRKCVTLSLAEFLLKTIRKS